VSYSDFFVQSRTSRSQRETFISALISSTLLSTNDKTTAQSSALKC